MKWRKVPKFPKWIAYEDGKHVATVQCDDEDWRNGAMCWVDAGNGFQRVLDINFGIPPCLNSWKRFAEYALIELRRRIASQPNAPV